MNPSIPQVSTGSVSMLALWLPILLSIVACFIASSIIWMALPIHKDDYRQIPNEDAFAKLIKDQQTSGALKGAGMFMLPWCTHEKPKGLTPEQLAEHKKAQEAKFAAGPWAVITIIPKRWNMGISLGFWLLQLTLLNILIAYIASITLGAGTPYLRVFQVVGTAAALGFGGNLLTEFIWKGTPWNRLPGQIFDTFVYVGLTAGMYSWLWVK